MSFINGDRVREIHGHTSLRGGSSPEYVKWANLTKKKTDLCSRWRDSFVNFLSDMGIRPSTAHSLERIDRRRQYGPGNCRWSTRMKRHGHTTGGKFSPEYSSWHSMKMRCGRRRNYFGITVCKRWKNSFTAFLSDMGQKPSMKHTLERIDGRRGYGPGNCCWATRIVQSRNTSRNHRITHQGRSLTLAEWSEEIGVKANTILCRIRRGWPVTRALIPNDAIQD